MKVGRDVMDRDFVSLIVLFFKLSMWSILLCPIKGALYRIQYYADGINSGLTPPG